MKLDETPDERSTPKPVLTGYDLAMAIRKDFAGLGWEDIELPPRLMDRDPPNFDVDADEVAGLLETQRASEA